MPRHGRHRRRFSQGAGAAEQHGLRFHQGCVRPQPVRRGHLHAGTGLADARHRRAAGARPRRAGVPRGAGAMLGHPAPSRHPRTDPWFWATNCRNAGRRDNGGAARYLLRVGGHMQLARHLAIASAMAMTASVAAKAESAPFYQGKQITIVAGFTTGGTYDATARLYARHLSKHLPGNPGVVVRNLPGSGGLIATLNLYNAAPKDGTALAVVGGGVVIEPLLGNAQATYDARRFNWIGGRSKDNMVCATWNRVPVRSMADVVKRETVVGATGPGSRTLTHPRAFNELLGTRFKIVSGYPGGSEITLAVERGELEGYCGWTVGSIISRGSNWLHDGTLTLLAQFTRDLPNVPVARDLAPTEEGKRVLDFLAADVVLAWPLVAPPDVPAERVAALRSGFLAMMKDPELRADAAKLKLEIDPVPGPEMQEVVEQLYRAPPDVIRLIKKINSGQ
ncbi:MAG: hypothetical protein GEU95_07715 [Rhizobiales bacterium]|nr:hypothetical protein [Hyphomicrobiales bacterium]